MMLSRTTASVLVDMIENRLAMIQISDREELREVMTLQRCLAELHGAMAGAQSAPSPDVLPTRGRRRKFSALMDDFAHHSADATTEARQQA